MMKAAALLVGLGVFGFLCGSCSPAAVAQQGAPGYQVAQWRPPRCIAIDTNRIVELKPGFDAASYGQCPWNNRGGGGHPPTPCPNPPAPDLLAPILGPRLNAIRGVIADAFAAAPQHLKDELCSVDNIFIDADAQSRNSLAWGMLDRSRQNAQGDNEKYIGISVSLFPEVAVQPYGRLETSIVQALLDSPPPPSLPPDAQTWLNSIKVIANNGADTLVTSTMAVLAHEMGHIIWLNEDVPGTSCMASPLNPRGISFQEITWKKNAANPHGFHGFGFGRNRSITNDFTETEMWLAFQLDDLRKLVPEMVEVYDGQNWTGLFSFVDADEDFIETYKYWVLANASGPAKLNSLSIGFNRANNVSPPITAQIVTNGSFGASGTKLATKRTWIEQWVQGPVPSGCMFPPP
jgi:hypothetical protein